VANEERCCRSRNPREFTFTPHGTSHEHNSRKRRASIVAYVTRRIGSMSVCSDGVVALGAEQAHGPDHYLEVEISVVLLRQRFQMTRTRGITTTFSVFCAQMMGMSHLIVCDHEASMALTQTCRNCG
jgi:hypothetical protein